MDELRKLLNKVPDSYFDFVEGLLDEAKKSKERERGLICYVKAHPQAKSSEVIQFLVEGMSLNESL